MTITVAERPGAAPTASAGTTVSAGWPVKAAQVGAWASGFGPELAVYLEPLGTILVAVTGDPAALETAARNWDGVRTVAGRVVTELASGEALLQRTTGEARTGADRLRRRLHQDFTRVAGQAESIASTLRIAGQDLVESRRMVIEVIRSFLNQAEVRRQAAVAAASSGASSARADYLTALGVLYETHHPHATEIYRALSERMGARADAWDAMSPSLLDRVWNRTKEFFAEDVPERLHEIVGTPGFESGVVDLGVASAVDAFWNDPRLRTALQGGGTYAGGNLTAAVNTPKITTSQEH